MWAVCNGYLYFMTLGLPLQILGNNECFEPYTSNIYVRRVLSGEFTVVNQHLLSDLTAMGLWSADTKNELVAANGSVQVFEPSAGWLCIPGASKDYVLERRSPSHSGFCRGLKSLAS